MMFKTKMIKPMIYVRYENIFVDSQSFDETNKLKQTLEENSLLSFTN